MALTKEMVLEGMRKGAVVVNVLGTPAFEDLHIKGSINIPLGDKKDDDFAQEVETLLGREKMIITHCSGYSCNAGPRAAAILKARGFKAEDYPGGIEEWSQSKLPVEGKKKAFQAA